MPIYRAGPVDAQVMADIHAMAFPPGEAWSVDLIAAQLAMPGYFGLVHRHGGMLLARVAAEESEILTIAVAPAVQGGGTGTRLLRSAITGARGLGASSMFLEVSVNNIPARLLYGRAGFEEVGRRPRYYPDGADALVLRLDLSPCESAPG